MCRAMQTFLPLPTFEGTARCLDRQRLGKQRVECLQLLGALHGRTLGWRNHPACRMWRGHISALTAYALAIIREWKSRGYRDTCEGKVLALSGGHLTAAFDYPPWFGDEVFHASHRSNLLRKDPEWYGQFGWTEPPTLPYVWPGSR